MAESPTERPHEELLKEAQERLAARLGGQWAVRAASAAMQEPEPASRPAEIVSQAQLAEAEGQNVSRLQELGLLAVGSTSRRTHYFAR